MDGRAGRQGGKSKGSTAVVIQKEPTINTEEPAQKEDKKEEEKVFSDMDAFEWAQEAVTALAKKNILNGKEAGKFYPSDVLKREELVKCLVCAFEDYLSADAVQTDFEDTVENAWYMPYITKAYANGIVNGIGENLFGIGGEISRQDLAVMCVRAAKLCGVSFETAEASFKDSEEIAPYAQEAVNMLYGAGIMVGDENGAFRPTDSATRAQAAKILYLILKKGEML